MVQCMGMLFHLYIQEHQKVDSVVRVHVCIFHRQDAGVGRYLFLLWEGFVFQLRTHSLDTFSFMGQSLQFLLLQIHHL